MRLTKQTNYAIRMFMYCASKDEVVKVRTVAEFYNIPTQFLLKILQVLVKSGLMESVQGRGGGMRLAKPAADISVADVVRATEDNFNLAECFQDGSDCPHIKGCLFRQALSEALDAFFKVLSGYTVADLVDTRSNIHVLMNLKDSLEDDGLERFSIRQPHLAASPD